MRGDERDVEAADEEAARQQHVARCANAARSAWRAESGSSSGPPRPRRGRSATRPGSAPAGRSRTGARSAVTGPYAEMKPWPSGAKRNWPIEPAAVARPMAQERRSGGTSRAKAAMTIVNEPPARPRPTSTPPVSASVRRGAQRHERDADRVDHAAGGEHAPGAVAVGDRARERLAEAPQQVLDRDRERERLAIPAAQIRQRLGEQPEARPHAERDDRDQAPGDDHDGGAAAQAHRTCGDRISFGSIIEPRSC